MRVPKRGWWWFRSYVGPNIYRGRGSTVLLQFIARADLTPPGRRILCGLEIDLQTRPLGVAFWSDADRITRLLATPARARR